MRLEPRNGPENRSTSELPASEQDRRDVSSLVEVARMYAKVRGFQLRLAITRDNIGPKKNVAYRFAALSRGGGKVTSATPFRIQP